MNKHRHRAVRDIVQIVAEEYGLTSADVYSLDRHRSVAECRAVCYVVARGTTRLSFPELGEAFERDHSTILQVSHSLMRKARKDEWLAKTIERCRRAAEQAKKARRAA